MVEQWHITLRFLGESDPEEVVAALRSVPMPSGAVATVGPQTGRFGNRVLHAPVSGLEPVARVVRRATKRIGKPIEARAFSGHLTLARARDRRSRVDLRPLAGVPIAGEWEVGEVALVSSLLGKGPARYEVVERFPLG